jgi:CRISPR-associated protein Cmr6
MILDALPKGRRNAAGVDVDVLTPHTRDYHSQVNQRPDEEDGVHPPAEYLQPVPVAFFSVNNEVTFTVHLIGRGDDETDRELALGDGDALTHWLARGLEELGLGAKTAAGYGYCAVEIAEADKTDGPGGDAQ